MGQLLNLKCNKCGYETNLGVGAGISFNRPDVVSFFFDKKISEEIFAVIERIGNGSWSVVKEIGVCEKCGKISAIAVFRATDSDGRTVEYRAKCPCGGEVELFSPEDVLNGRKKLSCPACGDVLEVTSQGYWD